MTRQHPKGERKKSGRKIVRDRIIVLTLYFGGIIVVVGTLLFGPGIIGNYDQTHNVVATCEVRSAEGQIASTVSRTGLGGARAQVVITTKQCGQLLLREGVTDSNKDVKAKGFRPASTYDFEIGEGSRNIRGLLSALNLTPEIYEYSRS